MMVTKKTKEAPKRAVEKFSDLLFYLVVKFGENGVVETKLMKLLYFTEANYYKLNEKTITSTDYFKNIYGPTPDIKILKKAEKKLSKFLTIKRKLFGNRYITIYKAKNKNYTYCFLTEQAREEADRVFRIYNQLPSDQLSKISHLDPPYLASKEKINFRYVKYRKDSEEDHEIDFNADEKERFNKDLSKENLMKLFNYAKGISQVR